MKKNKLIIKTERKHWVNGYITKGGGKFKSWAFSCNGLAVMICLWGFKPSINIYKLI